MTVKEEYVFSFKIPDEYNVAMAFKEKHPDFDECDTSGWINFKLNRVKRGGIDG